MPIEATPPLYTTRAEMEKIFSNLGINTRLDDDQSKTINSPYDSFDGVTPLVSEELYLDAVIQDATDLFNQYLEVWYRPEDLVNSLWIRRSCTWVACHLLSLRRGNPSQFDNEYQRILEFIQQISKGPGVNGNPLVPRTPLRYDLRPSHSNIVVDDHFPQSKIRVQDRSSSGDSEPHRDRDLYFFPD
jgi:hypothetical protein